MADVDGLAAYVLKPSQRVTSMRFIPHTIQTASGGTETLMLTPIIALVHHFCENPATAHLLVFGPQVEGEGDERVYSSLQSADWFGEVCNLTVFVLHVHAMLVSLLQFCEV